jgi:hypothetical protein
MSRPRPTLFEVHHSNFTKNGCTWYINGYPQGKRLQFWFKTEKEAKTSANERNAEITATGTQDQLPYTLRTTALEGAKELEPFGKTVADAVSFYLKHRARFADVPIKTLEGNEIKGWLAQEPLAIKTRNRRLGYVKNIFGMAKEWKLIVENPFEVLGD